MSVFQTIHDGQIPLAAIASVPQALYSTSASVVASSSGYFGFDFQLRPEFSLVLVVQRLCRNFCTSTDRTVDSLGARSVKSSNVGNRRQSPARKLHHTSVQQTKYM